MTTTTIADGILFDPANPEDSLMRLAEAFGDDQVFRMIGFIRDQRAGAGNVAGRIRHRLAKRMVETRMAETGCTYEEARFQLALELGYDGNKKNRSNFYAIVKGEARNGGMRPIYADAE